MPSIVPVSEHPCLWLRYLLFRLESLRQSAPADLGNSSWLSEVSQSSGNRWQHSPARERGAHVDTALADAEHVPVISDSLLQQLRADVVEPLSAAAPAPGPSLPVSEA